MTDDCKRILQDVRERVIVDKSNEKIWKTQYEERHNIYSNYCKNSKYDAERWPDAIESYKLYECFSKKDSNGEYFFNEEPILCYGNKDNFVRISADILTNVKTINRIKERHKPLCDNEEAILRAFYRVSYTIGAFCPIWRNPSPGSGAYKDIVWQKLSLSGMYDANEKIKENYIGIDKRENITDLRRRLNTDLFLIFPQKEMNSIVDIVTKLYFQDYFDYHWQLICPVRTMLDKSFEDRNYAYEFIRQLTVLIVQRSYRIITNYQGNVLHKKDIDIIKKVFEIIGLNDTECISTRKQKL